MCNSTRRSDSGVSSVFGSVLILMLVVTLASSLFISLYAYEEKAQESIRIEEERTNERITLLSLSTENISGIEYLVAISVNNTGTITTRIRGVYIDNVFVCDPTNPSLNPDDTYINPKDSLWIMIPNYLKYEPLSKIEVATERGMKSIEYEWKLKSGSQAEPPSETQRFHFGPLLLDFEKFYYTENYGSYDPNSWKPGWSVEEGTTLVWNVTVTNIDDRDITINKYSGFTMVSNDGGVQLPWFIEPPDGLDTLFIPSNSTAHLIYIWDRPRMTQGVKNQSVYNQNDRSKVFLTFFGIFHEHDGTTKPYGQTIPFEAVLVRDPQMVISAAPSVIAANSQMTSTITVTVRDVMGIPAPNVPVAFSTTHGVLSSLSEYTNSNGIATVTLSSLTTGTAVVTATWEGISKSVTVTISAGELSLSTVPSTVAAGSIMTSTIAARVTLNGNPLQGETVLFSATPNLGTLSSTSVPTNAQGFATVTFTPGSNVGTATITADWGTLSNSKLVVISSGVLSLSAAPPTVAAGSAMVSTITAHISLNGNSVAGETVRFSATPEFGTLSTTTATTNAQGNAIITFSPGASPGTTTITADWATLSQTTTVIITSGDLSLSAIPDTIAVGSTTISTITSRVTLNGIPLQFETVSFSVTPNLGSFSTNSLLTDSQGYATVTFIPGTEPGSAMITAYWGTQSQSVPLTLFSGGLSISTNLEKVAAGSTMTSIITAHVTVDGSPKAGETVTFSTTATPTQGSLTPSAAVTDDQGNVIASFAPGTSTGTVSITARWATFSQSTSLTIASGLVSVLANPATVNRTLSETSEIEVTVLLGGEPMENAIVSLETDSAQGVTLTIPAPTDVLGKVRVTLTPGGAAEYVEVLATWEGITGSTFVNIVEVMT